MTVELMQTLSDTTVKHDDMLAGTHASKSPVVAETTSDVDGCMPTAKEQEVTILKS